MISLYTIKWLAFITKAELFTAWYKLNLKYNSGYITSWKSNAITNTIMTITLVLSRIMPTGSVKSLHNNIPIILEVLKMSFFCLYSKCKRWPYTLHWMLFSELCHLHCHDETSQHWIVLQILSAWRRIIAKMICNNFFLPF